MKVLLVNSRDTQIKIRPLGPPGDQSTLEVYKECNAPEFWVDIASLPIMCIDIVGYAGHTMEEGTIHYSEENLTLDLPEVWVNKIKQIVADMLRLANYN